MVTCPLYFPSPFKGQGQGISQGAGGDHLDALRSVFRPAVGGGHDAASEAQLDRLVEPPFQVAHGPQFAR